MRRRLVLDPGDGRTLEFGVSGPAGGIPLVFHHGTPGMLPDRGLEQAAHERGLRLVSISRPGYGGSARRPGRAVVDVVADTAAVLRSIGAEQVLLAGWSGGGPHALACAARLPGAVGALIVAGLGPADGAGLSLLDGMDAENREEWSAAFLGEQALRAVVDAVAPALLEPAEESDEPPASADAAALAGTFGQDLLAANRDALHHGVDGWIDDELAFTRPWGFDLGEVDLPVSVWHGTDDTNVPIAHGRWNAEHLRAASFHREDGHGHLSIMTEPIGRMLDALLAAR